MKKLEVVKAVAKSANSKTGPVACTYAPIQSCPKDCPFLNHGCYAQNGHCGFHLAKLNKNTAAAKKTRPVDIAVEEASAIKNLKGDVPLRLHIVGDCKTPLAAEIVANACDEYIKKHNQPVWTYTHAWRVIPREKWGKISVLASCENTEEAKLAMRRGYAASMVRYKKFNKIFNYKDINMVPCFEMTNGIQCNKCKVCFSDKRLRDRKQVICFFPHGSQTKLAQRAIFSKKDSQ